MKIRTKLLIFFVLLILPIAGRWGWFYRGSYQAPDISELDESQIAPAIASYHSFEDEPVAGHGHVIIDLAHANNLKINDLAPLRDRLEARNVTINAFEGTDIPLKSQLKRATGFVVIAPAENYTAEEIEVITNFVEDGGRLLLAADPTRPVPSADADGPFPDLFSVLFPTSAVPAINSLANAFDVTFYNDYLYNVNDNEGNYRNVKFSTFANEHPLTQNLDTIVLFSTHSLQSDGLSLVIGDEETHSPVRSGETALTTVALTTNEQVLALGDITFLTAPYHTIADNDRFLSHIADWLAVDGRQRDDLEDFPSLFEHPVDLVQVSGEFLDPRLIVHSSSLQESFDQFDLTLSLRAEADPTHDALLVGTFDDLERVQDYLTTAGITVTMLITDDNEAISSDKDSEPDMSEDNEAATGSEADTSEDDSAEISPQVTPSPTLTATEETKQDTPTEKTREADEKEAKGPRGLIEIETIGAIPIEGANLYIVDRTADRLAIIILAEDGEKVIGALERLTTADFSGCIDGSDTVIICSEGEALDGAGLDTPEETTEKETAGGGASLFILSDDDGAEGVRTGAAEFEAILSASYDITVWSTSSDGIPTDEDLAGYDAYIIDSGDYAFDIEDSDTFAVLGNIEGGGIMLIGAQPFPAIDSDSEPINDLTVADATHPLADGFSADETITLLPSESGVPAMVITDEDLLGPSDEEVAVVFTRGPDSPQAGTPALIAAFDNLGPDGIDRIIVAPFAFYQLPEKAQRTLALNAAAWLVGE